MVDVVLERFQPLLVQGGVLVDEADEGTEPRLLVYLEHAIRDGRSGRSGEPRAISQRLQFIFLKEDGTAVDGGPAPYLDCRPITAEERALVADAIAAPWLSGHVESRALGYAIQSLVPQHLDEVKTAPDRRDRQGRARGAGAAHARDQLLGRARRAVARRGARRQGAAHQCPERGGDGGSPRRAAAQATGGTRSRAADFGAAARSQRRRPGDPGRPPQGRACQQRNARPKPDGFSEDPVARAMIEKLAMDAVMAAERMLGNEPRDVSAEKKGYDVESRDPRAGRLRFIEVKGRHADGRDVIVTKNEILASLNAPEAFVLAIVQVDGGFAREPVYVRQFFKRELGFAETAVVFNVE